MLFLTGPLFLFKRIRMLLPGTRVIVWDRLESPLVNILFTTKLLSLDPLSWDMDGLLTLWQLLIPCSLGNSCYMLGFLILITVVRNFLYHSLYILTENSLMHLCSIRAWVSMSFFLSLSLSLSGWFLRTQRPALLTLLPGLLRLSRRCPVPSPLLERAPGAFVRDASPVSRTLLVFCVNQGVSASFSLSLSYRRLPTARSRFIKGPQQRMTVYSLDVLLFLFGTSLLFHVQF